MTTLCTICRSVTNSVAYVVDGQRIVRCDCCSHLYLSPRPPMQIVTQIYSDGYFANPAFRATDHSAYFGYMDYLSDRENVQRQMSRVLARVEDHRPRGQLLDIGCGPGLFVEVATQRGWRAAGVDLNESAVSWARENIADQVWVGSASEIPFDDESVDCLTMFDVIEHLADPRAELAEVWRVLRPGGLLVLVTPDAGALVPKLLGRRWLEFKRAPEHLQFFSIESLARLLELAGFHPLEWHSIGKITSARTLLADLRFYSTTLFDAIEWILDRVGLADRVIDVDPRVKFCMYARKTERGPTDLATPPLLEVDPVPRVIRHGLGRVGVHRYPAARSTVRAAGSAKVSGRRFTARQRRYWEGKSRFLDPRLPGPTAFATPKIDWAANLIGINSSNSVIDVGAGNGTVSWHLMQRAGRVYNLDFSQNLLARSPEGSTLVRGDVAALPFGDDSVDVAFESNVLHHVADPLSVVTEMKRVARHHIVLIEPNRWHPPMAAFMLAKRSEWRGLRFDVQYVRNLAVAAGLGVLAVAPQGAVYPNQTPNFLLPYLRRFDRAGRLGAYVVAVLVVTPGNTRAELGEPWPGS